MAILVRLLRDEEGATIVEYALCLATFAIVAMVGMAALINGANSEYNNQTGNMTTYQAWGP